MATIIGEVTGPGGVKQAMLVEALQQALDNTPPPIGTDIQHFRLLSVELEHGGFVGSTTTRVTMDVHPGPLEKTYSAG